jgi:hypothetical protein
MEISTEKLNDYILDTVCRPVIDAALAVNLGERYRALLTQFPKIDALVGRDEHYVPLERQIAIMEEVAKAAGMPVRYYKSEGGYWQLDKKYPRKDISLTIEARQWIKFAFYVTPNADCMAAGGRLGLIYNAVRVSQGEVLDYETGWRLPPTVWCFSEEDFYQVTQEAFALITDLQTHISQGCTDGFRLKTKKGG